LTIDLKFISLVEPRSNINEVIIDIHVCKILITVFVLTRLPEAQDK